MRDARVRDGSERLEGVQRAAFTNLADGMPDTQGARRVLSGIVERFKLTPAEAKAVNHFLAPCSARALSKVPGMGERLIDAAWRDTTVEFKQSFIKPVGDFVSTLRLITMSENFKLVSQLLKKAVEEKRGDELSSALKSLKILLDDPHMTSLPRGDRERVIDVAPAFFPLLPKMTRHAIQGVVHALFLATRNEGVWRVISDVSQALAKEGGGHQPTAETVRTQLAEVSRFVDLQNTIFPKYLECIGAALKIVRDLSARDIGRIDIRGFGSRA